MAAKGGMYLDVENYSLDVWVAVVPIIKTRNEKGKNCYWGSPENTFIQLLFSAQTCVATSWALRIPGCSRNQCLMCGGGRHTHVAEDHVMPLVPWPGRSLRAEGTVGFKEKKMCNDL